MWETPQEAHARLGISEELACLMSAHGTSGLNIKGEVSKEKCKMCVEANLEKCEKPRSGVRAIVRPCQVIGSDLQSFDTRSYDGKHHLSLYVCYKSGCVIGEPIAKKSDQVMNMEYNLTRFEKKSGFLIDIWRADQGGEYINKAADALCQAKGIRREYSDTGEAFQNGLSEVVGKLIVRRMREARVRSQVPKKYWSENAKLQVFVYNRVSMSKHRGTTTPIRELTMDPTQENVSMVYPFGCEVWFLTRRRKKEKLEPRAERGVFMGVCSEKKAWRILRWSDKSIVETRNAYFYPMCFPYRSRQVPVLLETTERDLSTLGLTEEDELSNTEWISTHHSTSAEPLASGREISNYREDFKGSTREQEEISEELSGDNEVTSEDESVNAVEQPALVPRRSARVRFARDRFAERDFEEERRRYNTQGEDGQKGDVSGSESEVENDCVNPDELEACCAIMVQQMCEEEHREHSTVATTISFAVKNSEANASAVFAVFEDPKSEAEANLDPRWLKAEAEEVSTLRAIDAWEVVRRPKDKEVLPSKMVHKTKTDEKGNVSRLKARFVVIGCASKTKNTRDKTYAPTLRYSTLRVVLAIAGILSMTVEQADIVAAFLHGRLEDEVYVEQPKNFCENDPADYVLRLKKCLYGLDVSPRRWNETFDKEMCNLGYTRSMADPCLYFRHHNKGKGKWKSKHITLVLVFVDDLLLCSTDHKAVARTKRRLNQTFAVKDMGVASWALGCKITQTEKWISLDQRQYVKDVLDKYQEYLHDCPRSRDPVTPLPPGLELYKSMCPQNEKVRQEMRKKPYRELVGALLYLQVSTRVDLGSALSQLSQFLNDPGPDHWRALLHVVRYLRRHPDIGMVYEKTRPESEVSGFDPKVLQSTVNAFVRAGCAEKDEDRQQPVGYVDANHATDKETSLSVSGQVFKIGTGAVTWRSKKQNHVATSSCHAEFMASAECAREACWLVNLLTEVGFEDVGPMKVSEDNEAARFLSENPAMTDRAKHIRLRYHFVRECVKDNIIKLVRIPTKENAADMLTKNVTKPMFEMAMKKIGMRVIRDQNKDEAELECGVGGKST